MRGVAINLLLALTALGACGTPAQTGTQVTEQVQHYTVTATTRNALIQELRAKGPQGYWGRTVWTVDWSASCDVRVDVTYILPKHSDISGLPAPLRQEFTRALARLTAHEKQHGQHGIQAAEALERAQCQNAEQILRQFQQMDRDYDRRTRHGVLEGATLN